MTCGRGGVVSGQGGMCAHAGIKPKPAHGAAQQAQQSYTRSPTLNLVLSSRWSRPAAWYERIAGHRLLLAAPAATPIYAPAAS